MRERALDALLRTPRRRSVGILQMIRAILALIVLIVAFATDARAQAASCTSLSVGETQNITAHGVCRRVTLNSVPAPSAGVAGICVPTRTTAAEWASFYNNPPPGVTIAACASTCSGGYQYAGYCYRWNGGNIASCDADCASYGGCNAIGTRYVGSDDGSGSRCSVVGSPLMGGSYTATPVNFYSGSGDEGVGCYTGISYKGGFSLSVWVAPPTTTCSALGGGRICACNN